MIYQTDRGFVAPIGRATVLHTVGCRFESDLIHVTELSDSIKELRSKDLSYREISLILGCSKSTVSYHCGTGQKTKTRDRQAIRRADVVLAKLERYLQTNRGKSFRVSSVTDVDRKRYMTLDFQREPDNGARTKVFGFSEVRDKIGDNPTCYLSGRPIDITDAKSFEFDHIVPRANGGDNSLENLGVATKAANRAKHDLSHEEFLELCKDVLEHNGYAVSREVPI